MGIASRGKRESVSAFFSPPQSTSVFSDTAPPRGRTAALGQIDKPEQVARQQQSFCEP